MGRGDGLVVGARVRATAATVEASTEAEPPPTPCAATALDMAPDATVVATEEARLLGSAALVSESGAVATRLTSHDDPAARRGPLNAAKAAAVAPASSAVAAPPWAPPLVIAAAWVGAKAASLGAVRAAPLAAVEAGAAAEAETVRLLTRARGEPRLLWSVARTAAPRPARSCGVGRAVAAPVRLKLTPTATVSPAVGACWREEGATKTGGRRVNFK